MKKAGKNRMNKSTLTAILEDYFRHNDGRTVSFKDIFRELRLNTHPLKMLAIEIMDEMAWQDFLVRVSDNSYRLNTADTQVLSGVFQRKKNGRNSVLLDDSNQTVVVAERNSLFAMDGDKVKVALMAKRMNHAREAQVVEIVERAKDTFVGRLVVDEDFAYLVTNNREMVNDIMIPKKKLNGARTNDRVVVSVLRWPDEGNKWILGKVIDNLGRCGENDAEMNTILVEYGLPYVYPKAVEDAANKISDKITKEDLQGREDFRSVFTCTIDPSDAKDFDDALSIRKMDKGLYEVGVHIADVTHYVTPESVIEEEARKRATSIYLVDRTIPMLPERLCNNICSLRPNEEKLTYSCIFTLNEDAEILNYRICRTVIKSDRRFTYDEAQKILTTPLSEGGGEEAVALHTLWDLAKQLRERRFGAGAINFDNEEMKFELDKDGKPIRCYFKHTFEANFLIEEFMLLANRTVAEHIGKKTKRKSSQLSTLNSQLTFVYRVHDNPDPERMESLKGFTSKLGYKMKSTATKGDAARSLNKLLNDVKGKAEEKLISLVTVRAMQKAKYTVHNIGHFGLAFDYYTHFTSPIRRYPDMMVHRLLTRYADGKPSANGSRFEELCKHCSKMEVIASNAERDSVKYKAVEFMQEHIGEKFHAHISGVTSHGIYCEIDENHCEGLVGMGALRNDYYDFDEDNYCLRGRHSGKVYRLGDAVTICVEKANLEQKQLDYSLVD